MQSISGNVEKAKEMDVILKEAEGYVTRYDVINEAEEEQEHAQRELVARRLGGNREERRDSRSW